MKSSSRFDNSTSRDMADLYESSMMNKTSGELIQESYEKEQQIQEGWWDRAKMRGAQAAGAVKGAVQQGKGALQQKAGNLQQKAVQGAAGAINKVGNAVGGSSFTPLDASQSNAYQQGQNLQQQGQQNIQQGQQQAQQKLIAAAQKISQARTQQLLNDIVQDLQKVGFNVQLPQGSINMIQGAIKNAIQGSLK